MPKGKCKLNDEDAVKFYDILFKFENGDYKGLDKNKFMTFTVWAKTKGIVITPQSPYLSSKDENTFPSGEIIFYIKLKKNGDNSPVASTFIRHIRNSFAHANVTYDGEEITLLDVDTSNYKPTMNGRINKDLFFEMMDQLFNLKK